MLDNAKEINASYQYPPSAQSQPTTNQPTTNQPTINQLQIQSQCISFGEIPQGQYTLESTITSKLYNGSTPNCELLF